MSRGRTDRGVLHEAVAPHLLRPAIFLPAVPAMRPASCCFYSVSISPDRSAPAQVRCTFEELLAADNPESGRCPRRPPALPVKGSLGGGCGACSSTCSWLPMRYPSLVFPDP
jgi:hypothetical protein